MSFFFSYANHSDVEKYLSLYFFFSSNLDWSISIFKKHIFFIQTIKSQNGKFLWLEKVFVSYYFALFMALKTQNGNFLCLDKASISCYLTLFMDLKIKIESFHDLIKALFPILLLLFWLQNQSGKFLYLEKTLAACSFT